jgi:DNA-binding HxlR family transcriptional regulator
VDAHGYDGPVTGRPALDEALRRVGDRWSLAVVAALVDGPRRYGELAEELPGIAANTLAARLRQLESDGLVLARPYSERPRRFAYALTPEGAALGGVLDALEAWAGGGDAPLHDLCGTPLERRLYCPTCGVPVDADGGSEAAVEI